MKIGRIVKASDYNYVKMVNVPDEVVNFFKELSKKYKEYSFIVETNPENYQGAMKANIEVTVYDDYVE